MLLLALFSFKRGFEHSVYPFRGRIAGLPFGLIGVWHCIGINSITNVSIMVVIDKKNITNAEEEQTWENPVNPEKPADSRDQEQLERQLKEAERRKENLSDESKDELTKN